MNFLTYLYYKYYRFQVRVGNGDIALFTSILFMMFITMLYYWGIQLLIFVIFPNTKSWDLSYIKLGTVFLPCYLFLWCCLFVWRKKRYKKIIEYYEKVSPKSSWGAILFPIIGFLVLCIGFVLIILRNNGVI